MSAIVVTPSFRNLIRGLEAQPMGCYAPAPDDGATGTRYRRRRRFRAVSSAGEHFVDIEGVTGSIPVPPTILQKVVLGSGNGALNSGLFVQGQDLCRDFGAIAHTHSSEQLACIDLDGDLGEAELTGNLLVG